MSAQRLAKFHVRVHASNRHPGYGTPLVVMAETKEEAISRAVDLGWFGNRRDARVTIDKIEDVDPRECPHAAEAGDPR